MKKIIFICSCLLFSFGGTAQPTFEYTDISSGLPGSVRYNDPSVLGQRPVVNIKYDDIDGTPFWNDKWNAAVLVLNNGLVIKADKVKLNLYTNEVLYSDSLGIVMAAETGLIKRIYFFKGSDTTSSPSALYYLKLPDDTVYHYYQVLNYGESQLLKLKNIILYTKEPDALSGKT
ncbi:MAG TPA: hypothetical protein PL045_13175, partial [Chitinophagaceae bacterium]|nr:hypothetical protein [Chitinophagaceae bacterium]